MNDEKKYINPALAEEVASLKSQLDSANRLNDLGKIAAEVIHEMNSFLGAIAGNERVLERLVTQIKDEKLRQTFFEIISSNKTAITQVTSAMKFLKKAYHPEQIRIVPSMVNVNLVIEKIINLLEPECPDNVKFVKEFSEVPLISAGEGIVERIVVNLLHNAIHAVMDDGWIRVSTCSEDGTLTITIEDNGCGISPQISDKIFESHFTTKEVGKGTGLGLSIVRKLVEEELYGTIHFSSSESKGTIFSIRIPLAV